MIARIAGMVNAFGDFSDEFHWFFHGSRIRPTPAPQEVLQPLQTCLGECNFWGGMVHLCSWMLINI